MKSEPTKKLLKGVRVVDFSRILVGAYATMLLADLGAEVIKVEPPGGDETRKWGPPFRGEDSLYFLSINRNKKSICMDLKKAEARGLAKQLIRKSDILIENFTFGKMANFGLDYESVKKENKSLIYMTVNSYGNVGPMRSTPSFDLIAQAYTGVMNITGGPNTEPFKVGFPVLDVMAGSHAYGAMLAGLLSRASTGEGQYINTSLLETNIFAMPNIVTNYINEGINATRKGNDHPSISPYSVFKLKSGNCYAIGVATDLQFKKFWNVLDLDKINNLTNSNEMDNKNTFDHKFSYEDFSTNQLRLEKRDQLKYIISLAMNRFNEVDLIELFKTAGIPFSKINSMEDLFEKNEQIDKLELVKKVNTEDYGELNYIRNPITFSDIELEQFTSPPKLGKDTKAILQNILNITEDKVEYLYKNKIIY